MAEIRRELEAAQARLVHSERQLRDLSWSGDVVSVYGPPCELWALSMRFAALVAMRAGEVRRLDEQHTLRFFTGEPSALIWRDERRPVALVFPFLVSVHGHELSDDETSELEALLRGAIQRVETLHAEADLFRSAAELLRRGTFTLLGALTQAWAERGREGSAVPMACLGRLVEHATPRRCAQKSRELLEAILRDTSHYSNATALNALLGAALAADVEAESEVR